MIAPKPATPTNGLAKRIVEKARGAARTLSSAPPLEHRAANRTHLTAGDACLDKKRTPASIWLIGAADATLAKCAALRRRVREALAANAVFNAALPVSLVWAALRALRRGAKRRSSFFSERGFAARGATPRCAARLAQTNDPAHQMGPIHCTML
jgi:hypothetical protein